METFHLIVLSVAVVILILVLTFIGISMSASNSSAVYPPIMNTCPDYWDLAGDGKSCIIPSTKSSLNVGGIYDKNTMQLNPNISDKTKTPGFASTKDANNNIINSIDFTDSNWKGTCDKSRWANSNQIMWDGVSNYNTCS
jgi:hypothetical protein